VDGVASGKNPYQTSIIRGHQHSADAPLAHAAAGLLHRCIGRQGQRLLISHDIPIFLMRMALADMSILPW
jgi:hypothetical protein